MSIEFYFAPSPRKGDSIAEKDAMNRGIVEETINMFEDESKILRKQNILIFFDSMRLSLIQSLGKLIIKDTPSYKPFIDSKALKIKIPNLSDFIYIIYLSRKVRERDSHIFKVLTIAHEFQHVLQFLYFRDVYHQTAVLKGYLMIGKRFTNEIYLKLPSEVDAFKKSKIIVVKIFGNEKVNRFIEQEIKNSQNEIEKIYWKNLNELNIDEGYNLRKITQISWDKYVDDILYKIDELKQKRESNELEIEEENFLETCEFYFKEGF